jgi:molybdopterin-binding protein
VNKKLLVFVSSTYKDLQEERQAAVQAVLKSGHIPAGMELFSAGDKSQLETIYNWIDECDVYMLILGGRYGSIDKETGLSYTVRIAASDVMLAQTRPEGLSALNVLPATVRAVRDGDGPGTLVQLDLGGQALLARVTRRSATALGLQPGLELFAVVKSVSVAQGDVGEGPR